MSLLQQAGASEHIKSLEKIIAQSEEKKTELFYASSLTIDPLMGKDKEQSLVLRDLLTMHFVCYQKQHPSSEIIAGGTVRFKIEKWLHDIGWEDLCSAGPIKVKHLGGELVNVMHLREYSFEGLRIAIKWKLLWDDRLVIGKEADAERFKKAS